MSDAITLGLIMAAIYMGALFIYHFFKRYFEIKKKRRNLYKKNDK